MSVCLSVRLSKILIVHDTIYINNGKCVANCKGSPASSQYFHIRIFNYSPRFINPFNASCFKLLLFEGFSAILV